MWKQRNKKRNLLQLITQNKHKTSCHKTAIIDKSQSFLGDQAPINLANQKSQAQANTPKVRSILETQSRSHLKIQ